MIKKINNNRGQTALILILLSAAALIFLSITLNWGRISQEKSMLTMAADEAASLLASDAASYGQQEKQTNLKDTNYVSGQTGTILSFIMVIVAIVILVITAGAGAAATPFLIGLAAASVVLSIANLVLQLTVIQPGITSVWNSLQKDQPVAQQFLEEGISTALQGAVTDQVNITDYFDLNTNGQFGTASGDTISREGFFYTDRLKMLHQPDIPQVAFYYSQLNEFMNGESCAQNLNDAGYNPQTQQFTATGVPINPSCIDPTTPPALQLFQRDYCYADASDPACTGVVSKSMATITCTQNVSENNIDPNIPINPSCEICKNNALDPTCQLVVSNEFSFQLNDTCVDSNTGSSNYNPSCDPCCQPTTVGGTNVRPSNCDPSAIPLQCYQNNPYGNTASNPYALLYDASYQEYANGISFLDQFGRDQQLIPSLPLATVPAQGAANANTYFPNGIYPFFWLMNNYSPAIYDIDPTDAALQASQYHWCVAGTPMKGGGTVPLTASPPPEFPDLTQLGDLTQQTLPQYSLPYTCQGQDCCDNYLPSSVTNGAPSLPSTNPPFWSMDAVNSEVNPNPASNETFGEEEVRPWVTGDNQMCSTSWPYNGATSDYPDGTCELTGTTNPPSGSLVANDFTVDRVDDTMHTLSDFVISSNNILNTDVGTLSSTLDTWYPQAAEWIAPKCGGVVLAPACNEPCDDHSQCTPGGTCKDGSACGGGDGRLLSIYDTYTGADELSDWNTLMQTWLNATLFNPGAWCAPPESGPSMNYNGQATTENSYIASLGSTVPPTLSWPDDLPHVIACMNYNAAQNSNSLQGTVTSLYQACLGALTTPSACTKPIPSQCPPMFEPVHGCDPTYTDPNGTPSFSNWLNMNNNTLGSLSSYPQCLSALSTGTCPTTLPPECSNAFGTPPNYTKGNDTSCEVYQANSYAHWMSDMLNLNPQNNYANCQALLQSCPSSLKNNGVTNTACDPSILGRSLLDSNTEPQPSFKGSCTLSTCKSGPCNATYGDKGNGKCSDGQACTVTYDQWVSDSLTLFKDEQPKFALRSAFLTDLYSRAQTMQSIFAQGDEALQNFFKSCTGCAGDAPGNNTCRSNQCADGSACGSPVGQCEDGGPAAQLIWERTQPDPTIILPNSVIYGWRDRLPSTSSGGCTNSSGTREGCAHIVKVTALSAGRNQINGQSYIAQSMLPWINTTTSGSFPDTVRKFILTDRDGYVYVSVQRWDEDHYKPVSFPNGHTLWQLIFRNPSKPAVPQEDFFAACSAAYGGGDFGYGLTLSTAEGLELNGQIKGQDPTYLQDAFMLNGAADLTNDSGKNAANYQTCVTTANILLSSGIESHACMEYIASSNATGPSCAGTSTQNGVNCTGTENDYSMKFVDCNSIDGGNPPVGNP